MSALRRRPDETPAPASLVGARLLVVDDHVDLAENLVEILTLEGAHVVTAHDVQSGTERAAEGFDVALVDAGLPDGTGAELLARLKEMAPDSEAVLFTGQGSLDQAIDAMALGAYAYVLKPFRAEELIRSLSRAVRQVRSTRAGHALRTSLQEERDFITAVLDTAGALVLVLDPAGQVVRCNRACGEIIGLDHATFEGRPVWQALFNAARWPEEAERFAALLRGRAEPRRVTPVNTSLGQARVMAWSDTVHLDAEGRPRFVVWTGVDVTERHQAEAELHHAHEELQQAHAQLREEQAKLLQAEKLSSIGQLSAGVAHEINNPLGGVMSCFEALRDGRVPEHRRPEYEALITEGLTRIAATVRGLLDFARPSPVTTEELDVHEVVDASVRLLAPTIRKRNVEVELSFAPYTVFALADRGQLMQAIVNVVINASHASPRGGRIVIHAEEAAEHVVLAVSDQGGGIPEAIVSKVCDPFFTTKPPGEGTGLGMAITRSIIESHAGQLVIGRDAALGGARVAFHLPRAYPD